MKSRSFIVTIGSFFLVTAILYFIGYLFTIPLFMFEYEYTGDKNGFFISAGSLLPIFIGLLASFVAETVYKYDYRKNNVLE